MATQSHRSNGQDALRRRDCRNPVHFGLPRSLTRRIAWQMGTRTYMTSSGTIHVRSGYSWIGILLFTCFLSLLTATPARAQSDGCVSTYGGLIDGRVNPVPPAHIQFDGNCIIRNFPASNPFTSNSSFYGNNPTSWLIIFDNVVFTGNMSCDKSQGNFIWFTNGSISGLKPNCQNLFVATEKINKQN